MDLAPVNRLGSLNLLWTSAVGFTDRPEMTKAVSYEAIHRHFFSNEFSSEVVGPV